MEFHEIAKPIPMMNPEELGRLKDDIKANGLLEPIVLYEGKILDGRNRYLACIEVGIEPRYIQYEGDAPVQYAISKINRRNLNAGQLAFIALKYKPLLEEEAKKRSGMRTDLCEPVHTGSMGRASDKAGELLGVTGRYVSYAEEVKEKAPELVPQVLSGEMPLTKAIQEVKNQEKLEKRKEAITKASTITLPYLSNIKFQDAQIEPDSIDLILTDPPYGIEYKQDWIDLAEFAQRTLRPSGFLISYFGQINLPIYMDILAERLNYYWTFALIHNGNKQLINPRNIFCGWKPILVYQKPPFAKIDKSIEDIIIGSGREKDMHDWQQGLNEIEPLISAFTIEGEIIADPFAGSGTIIIAALRNNRKTIGFEIDEETYLIAKSRIEDFINEQ